MLKARRKRQKIKKDLDGDAKRAKRAAKLALSGPAVKKPKKERVKKEKVKKENVEAPAKKPKPTKEELGRQESKKKSDGGSGGKSAS